MRYRISKYIQFLPPEEYFDVQDGSPVLQNRVLMRDERNDRSFLVNSTIETFIKKFTTAKTCEEVTEEIATEINTPVRKVKKVISAFFKHSKHRHFIVPENFTEPTFVKAALFGADTVFDQYKIEKVIDTHRNIDVYLAVDLAIDNTVVIKLIKQPKEKELDELKREYNFLQLLHKTGVTPTPYSLVERTDYAYFTQEFIKGSGLPQFISRRKRSASKNLVMAIIAGIIQAFAKVHTENIVHGDVHPSNIIILNEAKVKVIDFGLAIHHELEKDELVGFGGVYFFMPPERIRKTSRNKFSRKPDLRSDVFQLGVVLYVLLYNEYPFNGLTWEDLAAEIKAKQIEFPATSQYGFLVPEWLKRIIKKCVAKSPSKRFANAQELFQAFSKKQVINGNKIRSAVKI